MERYVIVIPADEEQKARLVRCDDGDTCKLETLQEPVCCWQRPGWTCGSRDERREDVDENKEKARLRRAQRAALMNGAQGKIFTVTYQDYQKPEVLRTDLNSLPAVCSPALKACTLNTDSSKPAAEPEHRGLTAEDS